MIIVSGVVTVRPERRAEAVEAMRRVVEATRHDTGCLAYDFYTDVRDPNRFRVYEEWESDEALNAHLAAPHTQAFLAAIGPMAAAEPVVTRHEVAASHPLL